MLQAGDIQWENGTNRSADGNELFSETVVGYSIAIAYSASLLDVSVYLYREFVTRFVISLLLTIIKLKKYLRNVYAKTMGLVVL